MKMDNFDLKDLRNQIDEIDSELVFLFENRMAIVKKIAEYKMKNNTEILAQSREYEIIKKNLGLVRNKALYSETEEFLRFLLEISKNFQKKIVEGSSHA
jgi:chorismate mutase/prephenate dehydratase